MEVNLDELTKPFPPEALKTRQGDGKRLTYVEGHTVIRRLNAATYNNWNFEVRDIDSIPVGEDRNHNPRLLWKVRGALTIPGCGTRESIGVQVASLGTGEDLIKGAFTDCIKKCATLFGVGLELYGPDYEDAEPVDRATGEIHAKTTVTPQRGNGNAERIEASMRDEERKRVAKSLADLAGRRGVGLDVLDKFALDKIGKPLTQCDAKDLGRLITALQNETDVPGMIDALTNRPAPDQAELMAAGDRTPAAFR